MGNLPLFHVILMVDYSCLFRRLPSWPAVVSMFFHSSDVSVPRALAGARYTDTTSNFG